MAEEKLVKFLCVQVKPGESQEKLKWKVLKTISNSEKKATPTSVNHPLQGWTEDAHSIKELRARDVVKVASNSSYVTFLLDNGKACRLPVTSKVESSSLKTFANLDALRMSGLGGRAGDSRRFQVLGDEEYAQQLQSELNTSVGGLDWSRNRNISPPYIPSETVAAIDDRLIAPDLLGAAAEDYTPEGLFSSDPLDRWSLAQLSSMGTEEVPLPSLLRSRHSAERRGATTKQEKKKTRSWPDIGVLEWATVKQNPEANAGKVTFAAMSSLHSEVLLVSAEDRTLYSWSCTSNAMPRPHPLAKELGLEGERVSLLESSEVRATVVTETGKVATFYDELLRGPQEGCGGAAPSLVSSLTHTASSFSDLETDRITSLSVSSFISCATTSSGKLLWWGLCPPTKPNNTDHSHSSSHRSSSSRGTITDGILVRLRNGPPCGPNSIVFNQSGLRPRVGKTMNIIEHSGLDPKTSVLVKVYKDTHSSVAQADPGPGGKGRIGLTRTLEEDSQFEGLEVWSLSDVVFLDDSPSVLGRVVTVDQLQAIVDISHSSSESGTMGSTSNAQSTLKVFKISEIESCMDSRLSTSPQKSSKETGLPPQTKVGGAGGVDSDSHREAASGCGKGEGLRSESVSQHIAGLVQHTPVCLMCPHPKTETSCAHGQSWCVHGYQPLAIQMTDSGPMVLVKRLADGKAFLTCSGHTGFPSFMSSSFVSLSSRDTKVGRCTIEEESVSAVEGGYEKGTCPGDAGLGPVPADGTKSNFLSILKLHKSQSMMLMDVNGHICSLSEGLRLKPPLSWSRTSLGGGAGGGGRELRHQPMLPYKFVVTQTHMAKKNSSVMIVVAVPQEQHLMPAILSGDVTKMDSIMEHYDKTASSQCSEDCKVKDLSDSVQNASKPPPSCAALVEEDQVSSGSNGDGVVVECSDDEDGSREKPPMKKVKMGQDCGSGSEEDRQGGVNLRNSSPSSSRLRKSGLLTSLTLAEMRSKVDSDVKVLLQGMESQRRGNDNCRVGSEGLGGLGEKELEIELFYELSLHNSNILHVCGQLKAFCEEKGPRDARKPLHPSPLLHSTVNPKSYEESRLDYMTMFKGFSSNLWKVEGCGMLARRLWILDRLLNCVAIKDVVLNLLCQRNREGHTPFLSAIQHRNYAAASKMLEFLERHTADCPSLMARAVPRCCSTGLSAVHLLLASLSPHFDCQALVLYVSSFQLTTAQQLLKLFQVRYPSAYKAEVTKKGVDVTSDHSSGSSDGSGTEDGQGDDALENRRTLGHGRRHYRSLTNRRLHRNRDNLLSSSQSGRVYFSDVSELRAAAREMQGFRITSNVFRNTGFGTTQAISHLNVGLEPSSLERAEDRDELPYLMESDHRLHTNFFRDSLVAINRRKFGANAASHKGGCETSESSETQAYQLLVALLSHPSLVTAVDQAGETPLAAAVHNPRCIDRLTHISNKDQQGGGSSGLQPEVSGGVALSITTVPNTAASSNIQTAIAVSSNSSSSMSTETTTTDIPPHSSSGSVFSRYDIPYLSGSESSHPGLKLFPYTSPFGDMDALTFPSLSPTPSRDSSATPTNPAHFCPDLVSESADMDTYPSPTNSQEGHPFDMASKTNLDDMLPGDDQEEVAGQKCVGQVFEGFGNCTSGSDLAQKIHQRVRQAVRDKDASSPSKPEGTKGVKSVKFMLNPISMEEPASVDVSRERSGGTKLLLFSAGKGSEAGTSSLESEASDCRNALKMLFSDWPSIVMVVLGFDPACVELTLPPICSVNLLDNFITDLVLNCSSLMISYLVDAIITRLNPAIQSCPDASLIMKDLDLSDPEVVQEYLSLGEVGVALLVGRRFLGSVVRVLALEHSRIKNRFLEMQQARAAAATASQTDEADIPETLDVGGSSSRSRSRSSSSGGNSPRNSAISSTLISIVLRFSWLGIHAVAHAAESCSYPLRLGVSKPLGASSVVPDYQSNSRVYHSSQYSYVIPSSGQLASRQGQSLVRQLHVRVAKANTSMATRSSSCLPPEGLLLRPQQLEGEAGHHGANRTVGGVLNTSNASTQDDSSDEELESVMADGRGRAEAESVVGSTPLISVDPPTFSGGVLPNEVFLDLDSESSSDEDVYRQHEQDYLEVVGRESGGGVGHLEEDNLDTIYPFAWALDGRRIGENGVGGAGRSESPNSLAAMSMFNVAQDPPVPLCNIPSIRFGAGFLARTFARLVKDLVDISTDLVSGKAIQPCVEVVEEVQGELLKSSVMTLDKTWSWAASALDLAEAQLVQGQHFNVQRHVVALRGGSGLPSFTSSRSAHSKASRSFVGSTPGEYVMSLLRSAHHEDRDCLPVIDLYGYEHVVYVLDGLLYSLKHWPKPVVDRLSLLLNDKDKATPIDHLSSGSVPIELKKPKREDDQASAPNSKFFKRTESVSVTESDDSSIEMSNLQFFGEGGGSNLVLENPEMVGAPSSWEKLSNSFSRSLNEDYPLASQPHLLKPFAKKEALFRKEQAEGVESEKGDGYRSGKDGSSKGRRGKKRKLPQKDDGNNRVCVMSWSPEYAHQRWHSAISVFAHIFLAEGPGNERSNFLNARAGFASRMARFRHQVSQLYNASQISRDWAGTVSSTLSIRVKREKLMQDSLALFKQLTHFHYSNVRVKFDGEDGSGPGVNRGFFASFSHELKSSDTSRGPLSRLGLLFHEPGKQPEQSCLFAPHPFMPHMSSSPSRSSNIKSQRREAFLAVGRFLGFCLWFHYTVPFMVCRHVAKVLLGRPLAWHDLAFYNADLYEGLRQMMLDAELGKKDDREFAATYCSYFEAPLPGKFLEPVLVELIPGGSKIPVTAGRVHEYVRLYSMFMMVGCVQEELNALKQGLNDVIPNDLLSGLTAEDFQLLLSGGSAEITLARLKSIISFNHTHRGHRSVCDRFEKMFWRVVSQMNNIQRQQLLYFATGSAALPATLDTNTRSQESLTQNLGITMDVITVRNVHSLPVASTCSQRMCVPLYPSYRTLKKKLLQAIQCQAYGLG